MIFDVCDEWFAATAAKTVREHLLLPERPRRSSRVADPDALAHTWPILMKGSIVAAMEGDTEAAPRAKSVAQLVLPQHT